MLQSSKNLLGPRALITGGTGFIGLHLIKHLQEAGWQVHLLARPNMEHSPGIPTAVQIHPYNGETSDVIEAVQLSKPDVVFHLASLFLAQHTPQQVIPLVQANLLLGTQLLEAMSAAGIKFLINTGTSWQHFQSEQFRPVNLYAATKQAFEDILAYYADATGIRAINLLLFDSYGPDDTRNKLLHLLLESLTNDTALQMSPGHQVLDLVHVDDICRAFLHAARLVQEPNQPTIAEYAVSGGERMTLRDLVATLENVAGKTLRVDWGARPYRPREVMLPWVGPQMPGWTPEIKLVAGLKSLVNQRLT